MIYIKNVSVIFVTIKTKKNFIKLDCGHEFCKDCIKQTLQNDRRKTPCCAFCRTDITNFEIKHESIKNEFDELITSVLET